MIRLVGALVMLILLTAACKDSSDVQTLAIAIGDDGCMPASFEVSSGRDVKLAIDNETDVAYVVRDGDGRLEEITVDAGEAAEAFFDVPENDAMYTLVCESEGGASSEITLLAGTGIARGATSEASVATQGAPAMPSEGEGTLAVTLLDFQVTASAEAVPPGPLTIIATNVSSASTHELTILQVQADGGLARVAGIEPIAAQQGGSVSTTLEAGTYRLACQITPGEFGSTADHYQQGMWLDIVVEPEE